MQNYFGDKHRTKESTKKIYNNEIQFLNYITEYNTLNGYGDKIAV